MATYLTEGLPNPDSNVFPMTLVLQGAVPELPGVPVGSRVNVAPLEFPEVVTSQAFPMEPGRLYGWLLQQLLDGTMEVIPGPVSASEVIARLQRAVGASPSSPSVPAGPDPSPGLIRLK